VSAASSTPGPWRYARGFGHWEICRSGEPADYIGTASGRADARLIATAPALLELARHIVAMADDAYLDAHPEWAEIVKKARVLVAQAVPA
jgi:hypothetical protein